MFTHGMVEKLRKNTQKSSTTVISSISISQETPTPFIQHVGPMSFFSGTVKLENKRLQEPPKQETNNGQVGTLHWDGQSKEFLKPKPMEPMLTLLIDPTKRIART